MGLRQVDMPLSGSPAMLLALQGGLYALSLLYNYIARLTLEEVDFKEAAVRVIITVDKSKAGSEIHRFNNYVLTQIKACLDPLVPLEIFHVFSERSPILQATDMFAWGIFRKYEKEDLEWYDIFKARLRSEKLYLP